MINSQSGSPARMVRIACTYLLNVEALHARLSSEATEEERKQTHRFQCLDEQPFLIRDIGLEGRLARNMSRDHPSLVLTGNSIP